MCKVIAPAHKLPLIKPVIVEGLGVAIMDRIKKAVFKYKSIK